MLLVLMMVVGMLPVSALAAENAAVVDAAIIFTDLHTNATNYKESTIKNIMTMFRNTGLPFSSVTSGGDAFSVNKDSDRSPNGKYAGDTSKITGYIHNALGDSSIPVNYVWSDHDRYGTGIDKNSGFVYGAGQDGVYGTADDGNYYIYNLSMADLSTNDRYSSGFHSNAQVTSTIAEFVEDAAKLDQSKPLFIASHQPLFDRRDDNGHALEWCTAINQVAETMDVAFFFGHNHKYDKAEDYYYAKGSSMAVTKPDYSSQKVTLNFTHLCAGYLEPSSTGSTASTTRQGTAMAIVIYEDSIRYTTYNANGIYTGNYSVDKTVTRDFAVSEPEEPSVPSEPAETEPTAPSEPEAAEPPVSDEVGSEKVYVLVDAPVDGGKYLIVNQTLTNGDLSKDWDTDDDGMAVIRNGEGIAYSYAVPKAGTITDASGEVYTKGYIESNDENAVWIVHASGKAWTKDGHYLHSGRPVCRGGRSCDHPVCG